MQPSHLIRSEKVLKMAPFDRSEKGATARKPNKKKKRKMCAEKKCRVEQKGFPGGFPGPPVID
jgi:hypothetical protein